MDECRHVFSFLSQDLIICMALTQFILTAIRSNKIKLIFKIQKRVYQI